MEFIPANRETLIADLVGLHAAGPGRHDQLPALDEVRQVFVPEGLADELRLPRQCVAGDSTRPGVGHDLDDALLRLLVRGLGDRLPHGADEVAHEVPHETAGVVRVRLRDDGAFPVAPHREDERDPPCVLQRLAVEVVRLVSRLVGLQHLPVHLVVERLERGLRAVIGRNRPHRLARRGPAHHLPADVHGHFALGHEMRLRTRLRNEEQVPREPSVPQIR